MTVPPGWSNPITARKGQTQKGVDARLLLPSRHDLEQGRLDVQRQLFANGITRATAIQVNEDGVIWDGHHAVRAAAEMGALVEVEVVSPKLTPVGVGIMDLPVR